jgi:transposase-like protein
MSGSAGCSARSSPTSKRACRTESHRLIADAEDDVTAYATFPRHHWRKIWFTNPQEQVNNEIKRTDVVGEFPNDGRVLRLVGVILTESHDGRQTSDHCDLTMNNAIVLKRNQPITLELETA